MKMIIRFSQKKRDTSRRDQGSLTTIAILAPSRNSTGSNWSFVIEINAAMLNSRNFRLKNPRCIGGAICTLTKVKCQTLYNAISFLHGQNTLGFEVKKYFGSCEGSSDASRLVSMSGLSSYRNFVLLVKFLAGNRFSAE